MLTAAHQCFLTEGRCSALWEQGTAFPWHGIRKEAGRCDNRGGRSQQNKTRCDENSREEGRKMEAAFCLSSTCHLVEIPHFCSHFYSN